MCGRAGLNCLRRSSPCLSWISSDISPSTGCSFLGPVGEDAHSGGQWCHQAWPCAWHGVLPAASHKMSNPKVSWAPQEAVSFSWSCALSWGKLMRGIPIAAPTHCCWHRGPELCHTAWRGLAEGGQRGIQRWAWLAGLFLGGLPVIVPLLLLPVPSTVCSARPRAAAARRCCAACPCERLSILVT